MKSRGRKYPRPRLSGIANYYDSERERPPLSARSPFAAIVLCAGEGTRMKSGTAKVLHPILGRPLCAFPIARALDAGASPVVAVVGFQGDQVTSALQKVFPGRPLRFAWQGEQRGTAHAVQSAKAELEDYSGPILILYGDVPLLRLATLERLLETYRSHRAALAIITSVAGDPTGYGRVVRTRGRISRVVEQRDCSEKLQRINECNAGVYVVDSEFLWRSLPRTRDANAQREFYLTDLVAIAAAKKKLAEVMADFSETAGVNDRQDLADCARAMRAIVNSTHLKNGVSLQDPATAYIDEGVQIGRDTEIGPVVSLCGASRIGEGVRIGQGSVIVDSIIGNGTEVRPYSHLEGARVGERCILGPFCHLRPGTDLAESVHIGNFVETKKASIGKASKANHLSYLGDARIGAGVNIGAGTITCNYDGANKYVTVLKDNVFVGSDTQFVAPVTVEAGSYIAAGTTVTEDVPAMSLVLSRTPQIVKEGWVEKRKGRMGKKDAG
jgi:bifunctional UDP-N-acetylglucosamine pyrophosphorylase / glucosamine-1-phosphate N-acetyltransferase